MWFSLSENLHSVNNIFLLEVSVFKLVFRSFLLIAYYFMKIYNMGQMFSVATSALSKFLLLTSESLVPLRF